MAKAKWRRSGLPVFAAVGALAALGLGGATLIAAAEREDRRQVRRYQAWRIDGPPCPAATLPDALRLARKRSEIDDDITIGRENGAITCLGIQDHGGHGPGDIVACHLSTPGAVVVITPSRTLGFEPGPGRSAAVFVATSGVTCVVGVNRSLFAPPRPYE